MPTSLFAALTAAVDAWPGDKERICLSEGEDASVNFTLGRVQGRITCTALDGERQLYDLSLQAPERLAEKIRETLDWTGNGEKFRDMDTLVRALHTMQVAEAGFAKETPPTPHRRAVPPQWRGVVRGDVPDNQPRRRI